METAKEMIERVRKRMEDEPFPVILTKWQWAQIVGVCNEAYRSGATDDNDIRWSSVIQLKAQLGLE